MDEIYCSKCGEKNSISEDYCIECGSILRKLDKYESGDRITSFEDMFTQKHKEQLNETPLTNEIYELILTNIYMKQAENPLKNREQLLWKKWKMLLRHMQSGHTNPKAENLDFTLQIQ